MFGTTFSNTNQSQSPFGVQQAKQNTGFFAQTNPSPNSFGQNTTSAFGQIQNNPSFGQNTGGQGLFPGQQQQTLQGGPFGQSNPNQGGGGIFGQSTQQTIAPGLFGGQQQQSGNSGLFGQQTPTNTAGNFGNQQPSTSNVFGGPQQGNQGGIFGQQSQPAQQGGLFGMQSNNTSQQTGTNPQGQGLFGASGSTQQGGGLFGQSNLSATSNSPFGGVANNANQSFLGNQGNTFQGGSNLFGGANQNQNQNQGIGLFGSTQPSTSPFGAPNQGASNLFGGNTQQQQSAPGGNPLFGTFASPAQNATGNAFGAPNQSNLFGGQPQAQQFGQNQNAFNQNTNSSNKLGGTSWGVPTNPVGATQASLVQPVRSKNSKLDAKHLVKCIVALDQFQGLSK
jgi:nuclear pore complex protein Nup98-Nup96